MAYKLHYSDYSTTSGPPDPVAWIGPPGPMGPPGPAGPVGPHGAAGIPTDAPVDGTIYGRGGFPTLTWQPVLTAAAGASLPFLPLSGGTVTGATNISPTLMVGTGMDHTYSGATWMPQFWLNTNLRGSTTAAGTTNLHEVTINADTLDASGSSGKLINYLGVDANMGGAAMKGNRQGVAASIMLSAPSGNTPQGGAYVGVVGTAAANAPDHGTGLTPTTAGGGLWGANFYAHTTSGCTNFGTVIGIEVNPAIGTGSTATQIIGVQVVPTSAHTVRGAFNNDTGYLLSSQNGATGIDVGYACGSSLGVWPIRSDGAVMRAQLSFGSTATARYGVDLGQASFPTFAGNIAGGAFVSNGFAVDGFGAIQCGNAYLSPGSAGLSIDAKGSVGSTLPTIASGGTGYGVGAALFDPYGGIYTVTAVGAGGAVTSIAALVGPHGETHSPYYPTATTPTNPIATTTWAYSTGASGCTLNLVWNTTATNLYMQPTGGHTYFGTATNQVAIYPSGGNTWIQGFGSGGLIIDGNVGSLTLGWNNLNMTVNANANFVSQVGFNGTAHIAKPTGWGAPTGTATRTTFVTGSVTLPALAEHVKALIDDLTSYGLIGT